MEIRYRREMKRNYLIVEPESGAVPGYEARMLVNNSIEGLLRFHIKYMDEHQLYYYEITSMQPLGRLLESRFITREEICRLLVQLNAVLMRMEEYFLSDDGLLLEPEYIYVEPEWFGIGLCLVPGGTGDFLLHLSRLLQYLMKKVDHRDKESVVLAYGLYQESQKDNYGMEDLIKLIQKDSRTREAAVAPGEMQHEQEVFEDSLGDGEKGFRQSEEPLGDQSQARPHGKSQDRPRGKAQNRPRGKAEDQPRGKAQDQSCGKARDHLLGRHCGGTKGPEQPDTPSAGPGKLLYLMAGQAALWCLVFVGGPALIWLLKGPALIKAYWKLGIGAAGMALAVIAVGDAIFLMLRKAGRNPQRESAEKAPARSAWDDQDPWDLENDGWKENSGNRWEINYQEQDAREQHVQVQTNQADKEPVFQTTLLAAAVGSGGRRLEAGTPEAEDIDISYFPYIVGKQEDLVDYVLKRETVSRLHLRIDKEGEEYRVTDLNSTNGTQVEGRLLEANETVIIRPGETLCIADLIYTFK